RGLVTSERATPADRGRPAPALDGTRPRTVVPSATRPAFTLLALWLAGALSVLLWCAVGHFGLSRLRRNARPFDPSRWRDSETGRNLRVNTSVSVSAPVTWGWLRPVILLPREAESWPAERIRVALEHELAHVARRDYLAQTLATLACAVYWFHPLVWL